MNSKTNFEIKYLKYKNKYQNLKYIYFNTLLTGGSDSSTSNVSRRLFNSTPGTPDSAPGTPDSAPGTPQPTPGTSQAILESPQPTPGTPQPTPGTSQVILESPEDFTLRSNLIKDEEDSAPGTPESQNIETGSPGNLNLIYDETPTDIETVYELLNYEPYTPQDYILLYYLTINGKQKFDFKYQVSYYDDDLDNLDSSEIVFTSVIKKRNIFDTLFTDRKILLQPNTYPYFIFYDVIRDKRDEGIDGGGLTKTVFFLLSEYLGRSSDFFEQDSDTKLYKFKQFTQEELEEKKEKIKFLGQIFALAIKLKLQIEIEMDLFILYQMIRDDFNVDNLDSNKIIEVIEDYDKNLFRLKPYICYKFSPEMLKSTKEYCLYSEKEPNYKINEDETEKIKQETTEKIKQETTEKIKQYYIENKETIKLFVEGFRSVEGLDIYQCRLIRLPIKLFNEMLYGIKKSNYKILISNIKFEGFEDSKQIDSKQIDSKQIDSMKKLIRECICFYPNFIDSLILYITGTSKIPSIGYPLKNPLKIILGSEIDKYPYKAQTCFNSLTLNKKIFQSYYCSSNIKETKLFEEFNPENFMAYSTYSEE